MMPRRRTSDAHVPGEPYPTLSLVIPAWNEAALLPRLLESAHIARSRYAGGAERIEVVVADDGSTDDTAAIAQAWGAKVARTERRRIAAARNAGAAAATGELLAFVDADFQLHPDTFTFIADALARPDIVGGGTGLTMERWSAGIRTTLALVMPPLWLLGFDGGVWFCRRDDFHRAGGYDESVPVSEDVRFLIALQRLGRSRVPRQHMMNRFRARRVGLRPPLAINSSRKWDRHGEWHVLRDVFVRGPRLVFDRGALEAYIERYWYSDRRS